MFCEPPTPALLNHLSGGQLASRLGRSLRLYVLLHYFYGSFQEHLQDLPQPFGYQDLAQRLFAPSHRLSEQTTLETLRQHCQGTTCLCQQTGAALLLRGLNWERASWIEELITLTGLGEDTITAVLQSQPFGVVHRVLRTDLTLLVEQGWLQSVGRGRFRPVSPDQWPLPSMVGRPFLGQNLSPNKQEILWRALESIAFVQPDLPVILEELWQQRAHRPQGWQTLPSPQRIFIHLDYILSEDIQERVDDYQAQIEALWQSDGGGVIQFNNWVARQNRCVSVTVYPVCLHYVRRAKYLSAYGQTPEGSIGWHNYRLDRIDAPGLRVLAWDDPQVPAPLRMLQETGRLPTPEQVQAQLEEAWGFNFYLPKALLIMRFEPEFARWYVQGTERHPTFRPIPFRALPSLISQLPIAEGQKIKTLLARRSPKDAYFTGWVRLGDTNLLLRLRGWRPQGEVIAPLSLRHQMITEAQQEWACYGQAADSLG